MGRRPTFVQAFLITICGAALAFFGCLGALSNIDRSNDGRFFAGATAFVVGALVFLAGLGLFAFVIIRAIVRAVRNPAPPPTDSEYPPPTRYGGSQQDSNDPRA